MPDIGGIFSKQRRSEKGFSVPLVIRLTVIVGGSLCISGTIGIAVPSTFPYFIIYAVVGFVIVLAAFWLYYYIRKFMMNE